MKKRLGAIILVAAMLLSLLSIPAVAANVGDFSDVNESAWYYGAVKFTVENELFKGTAADTFAPNGDMTRAMFVTVLLRMENWLRASENAKREAEGDLYRAEILETEGDAEISFTDADTIRANADWSVKAVEWGAKEGIIKGYADNTFRPNEPVTREHMALFIKRYVDYHNKENNVEVKGPETPVEYADVAALAEESKGAIKECTDKGILIGWDSKEGTRNFWPALTSTRAEVSQVFKRLASTLNPEVTWQIIYDANGGTSAPAASEKALAGDKIAVTTEQPTRSGFTFLNWNTKADGTGDTYKANDEITSDKDVTLYAIWQEPITPPPTPEKVTISYDANKPTDKIFEGVKVIVDKASEKSAQAYADAEEYVGKGEEKVGSWTEDGGRLDIIGGDYTFGFKGNDGEIKVPEDQTDLVENSIVNLETLEPEYIGFKFLGWSTSKEWNGTDKLYAPGEEVNAKEMTLYAAWEPVDAPIVIEGTVNARLGDDFVNSIIATAAYAAAAITSGDRPQAKDLYERVENIVKELAAEYGLYDEAQELWSSVRSNKSIRAIINEAYDLAYDFVTEKGPAYWANFRDDNGYYFDKMTITVAGQELYADTNAGQGPTNFYTQAGDDKKAAKAIAKQIALDLEAQLKENVAPTDQIKLHYEATVEFAVNSNGDYSNPKYELKGYLNLDGNDNVQYYWDGAAHVLIANVKRSDVKDLVKAVVEAFADKADSMLLDKLKNNVSAGFVIPTYKSIIANANPGDLDETLLMQGVNIDDMAADYGMKFSKEPYGPVLKDYVLAVISDYMNKKAAEEYDATYDPTNAALFATKPEAGWVANYEDAMLTTVTEDIDVGVLAKLLTKEKVIEKIGGEGSSILDNIGSYLSKIPASAKVEFNGYTFTKDDLADLRAALNANDYKAVLTAISDLLKKPALKDITIKDLLTKDATTGGVSATISVRDYEPRTFTLRILDVEAAG